MQAASASGWSEERQRSMSNSGSRVRDSIHYEGEHAQQGGQAALYHGTYNGHPAAVKVMPKNRNKHKHVELRALQAAGHHPHVVHWHAAHQKQDGVFVLALELAYCDMLEVLHSAPQRGLGSGHRVREWMLQVASAGTHLHARGIAHRDLKPENLLLCSQDDPRIVSAPESSKLPPLSPSGSTTAVPFATPKSPLAPPTLKPKESVLDEVRGKELLADRPIVKICDFGYAAMARDSEGRIVGYSPVGSMRYAPPEVYQRNLMFTDPDTFLDLWGQDTMDALQGTPYDACAADVWSFGVTLYVLVLGSMPFKAPCVNNDRFRSFLMETQPAARAHAICTPSHPLWHAPGAVKKWRWPRANTPALAHLIAQCMAVDPADRPTFHEVAAHPWFTKPSWDPAAAARQASRDAASAAGTASSVGTGSTAERVSALPHVPSFRTFGSSHRTLASDRASEEGSVGTAAAHGMGLPVPGAPMTARELPASAKG